jgi:hypothetical protein
MIDGDRDRHGLVTLEGAIMARVRFTCLLAIGCLVLGASAHAADPPGLEIRIGGAKRLHLGKRGYLGKLMVMIMNRSAQPVTFHHEENNYLVFEGASGKLEVICHSCACMMNSAENKEGARQFAVTLPPGGKKELIFADWGCAGSYWRGPPAGTYRVTYRVFLDRRVHHSRPNKCCDELRAEDFWKGAIVSSPIKLAIVGKRPAR